MSAGEAKIFLSEKRGRTESGSHRSFHTFNFGTFSDVHHEPFFSLVGLNDETLAAGKIVSYNVAQNQLVWILPLIGGIESKVSERNASFIEVGESEFVGERNGSILQLRNPYEVESVNYLTLWLTTVVDNLSNKKVSIDLARSRNSLVNVYTTGNFNVYIGKFSGRVDHEFIMKNSSAGLFVFVIEGAVEFDNRLIQPRDGLAIWNKSKIEFESLSNETILILIEL